MNLILKLMSMSSTRHWHFGNSLVSKKTMKHNVHPLLNDSRIFQASSQFHPAGIVPGIHLRVERDLWISKDAGSSWQQVATPAPRRKWWRGQAT